MKRAPRKTVWIPAKGWKRTVSRGRAYYFHAGKRTSAKKFTAKVHRVFKARKKFKLFAETPLPEKESFNLCNKRDREKLYTAIKRDDAILQKRLTQEDYKDLRIVFEIGFDVRRKTKRGKRKSEVLGRRVFRGFRKFKRFLGLDTVKYGKDYPSTPVDWTPDGACKYKKRAHISRLRFRGDRSIGEKIFKKYDIA